MIRETDVTFTTELKKKHDVEGIIGDAKRSVLIAENNKGFAGFALLGSFRGGPGYAETVEHTVYLMPAARGAGVGRQLLTTLTKRAVELGHHVMVGAISGNNIAAVRFHQKLGFDQVARMPQVGQKNGLWYDLILMQKIIETCTDTSSRTG